MNKEAKKIIEDIIETGDRELGVDRLISDLSESCHLEYNRLPRALKETGRSPARALAVLVEQNLGDLIWKKLDSSLKSKLDRKQLNKFIELLDDDMNVGSAAKSSKIPLPLATELVAAVEKMGFI